METAASAEGVSLALTVAFESVASVEIAHDPFAGYGIIQYSCIAQYCTLYCTRYCSTVQKLCNKL